MADLHVTVAGVDFSNPLIAASGTFGFGREYNEFYPLSTLGGISSKGITLKERLGNPPPRIAEAPGCMLNAMTPLRSKRPQDAWYLSCRNYPVLLWTGKYKE